MIYLLCYIGFALGSVPWSPTLESVPAILICELNDDYSESINTYLTVCIKEGLSFLINASVAS